nr:unnamed protein product [Callosobruchus chinensis]
MRKLSGHAFDSTAEHPPEEEGSRIELLVAVGRGMGGGGAALLPGDALLQQFGAPTVWRLPFASV